MSAPSLGRWFGWMSVHTAVMVLLADFGPAAADALWNAAAGAVDAVGAVVQRAAIAMIDVFSSPDRPLDVVLPLTVLLAAAGLIEIVRTILWPLTYEQASDPRRDDRRSGQPEGATVVPLSARRGREPKRRAA